MTRRELMRLAALGAGALVTATRSLARMTEDAKPVDAGKAPAQGEALRKAIPVSGEKIAAIGLGTNNYSVSSAEDLAARRDVLRRMPELGGMVIDTAPAYGKSEIVLGDLMAELGNRERFFLATKVTAPGD